MRPKLWTRILQLGETTAVQSLLGTNPSHEPVFASLEVNYLMRVKKLHEVESWEDLGQWCWIHMLCLRRAWQTAMPFRRELPSIDLEESIDSHVRSMLRTSMSSLIAPDGHKPWILARLQFVSGLLQPSNVRLLRIPELNDPTDALQFLLLEEWYDSGREFWPLIGEAIAKPDHAVDREVALFS